MKKTFSRWWFGVLADYHGWQWNRLQRRANVHFHMIGYCENRVDELDQEASNART